MTIGDRIRERRKELGMTQEELAKAAGYSGKACVNKLELAHKGAPVSRIEAIAKALKISPSVLCGWE